MKKLIFVIGTLCLQTAFAEHAPTPSPAPGGRAAAPQQVIERPAIDIRCRDAGQFNSPLATAALSQVVHLREPGGHMVISDDGDLVFQNGGGVVRVDRQGRSHEVTVPRGRGGDYLLGYEDGVPRLRLPLSSERAGMVRASASGAPHRYVSIDPTGQVQRLVFHNGARSTPIDAPVADLPPIATRYAFNAAGTILSASNGNGDQQFTAQIDEQGNVGPWHRVSFTIPNNWRQQPEMEPGKIALLLVQNSRSIIGMGFNDHEVTFRRATSGDGAFNAIRHEVSAPLNLAPHWTMPEIISSPVMSKSGRYAAFAMSAVDTQTQQAVTIACLVDLDGVAQADRIPPPQPR